MTHPLIVCGFQGAMWGASTGFAVFVGILYGYRQNWQVDGRKLPPSVGREATCVIKPMVHSLTAVPETEIISN